MSKKIICFIGCLLISLIGYSQVPGNFSYQAVIRDESNNLVQESNVSIRISILQELYSSTPIYSEVHFLETNANGLLTLQVGTGEAEIGNFNSIDWLSGDFFLKSEVDITGGDNYTISSTSQLLSVPFAFVANRSQKSDSSKYAENAKRAYIADSVLNLPDQQLNSEPKLELRGDTLFLSDSNFVVVPGLGDINTYRKPFSFTYGGKSWDWDSRILNADDNGYLVASSTRIVYEDVTEEMQDELGIKVFKIDNTGVLVWEKLYGGSRWDVLSNFTKTSDGDYLIIGSTYSNDGDVTDGNNGKSDIWILKLDDSGNKIWDKTFGGTNYDNGKYIHPTLDGGYLIGGSSSSNDGDNTGGISGNYDIWILKLDTSANKVWDKTFGGSSGDRLESIIQTSNGNYIISGTTYSSDGDFKDDNYGESDICILKLDDSGNKIWDKTFGGSGQDEFGSILQLDDGNFILAGWTSSDDGDITTGNIGELDLLILRLDADGNKVWVKTFGGDFKDAAISIKPTDYGGYLVVGYTYSSNGDVTNGNNGESDIWILKLDADGNKVWDKTYGGTKRDFPESVLQLDDGTIIISGSTYSNDIDITDGNNGEDDIWIIKLDSNGNIVLIDN